MEDQTIVNKAKVVAKFSSEKKIRQELRQLMDEPVLNMEQLARIEIQIKVLDLALRLKLGLA